MIKLRRTDAPKVKPIKLPIVKQEDIMGGAILPLYSNTYILSKKHSGKSTVVNHILKNCSNKLTQVFIFCSTIHKDAAYERILAMLDKRKIAYNTFTSIMEDGVNQLDRILTQLQIPDEPDSESSSEEETRIINCSDSESDGEYEYVYRPKKVAPEIIFLFDDVSAELKNPSLEFLLKRNRHFKSKVIISSQYLHDLRPASIMNLDVMLIGGNVPPEKLKIIHSQLDLAIPLVTFQELYTHATQAKYSFFKIDIRDEKFFRNFDMQYQLDN